MKKLYSDYEWYLEQDLSEYAGKWVAILNKKVVTSDKNVGRLLKKFKKKYPNKTPFIAKIDNRLRIGRIELRPMDPIKKMTTMLLSEKSLAKEWNTQEEDEAWKNLQRE